MRIVSLLPAATEWIAEFGAADELVGRSHECDYPAAVQDVPVVTESTYDADGDSAAIDNAVQGQLREGLSLYQVDMERVKALEPDLIVTQDQCEVCAVSLPELEAGLRDWAGRDLEVLSMRPPTLKAVLDEALKLGRALDRLDSAMQTIGNLETGLQVLRDQIGVDRDTNPQSLPSVACIEWLEPLMVAGHWMPDVAEMAGGRAVIGTAGEPTERIAWDVLRQVDPDVIALMPCGFTIEETQRDIHYLTERDGWADLTAVRNGRVALLDGNAYFNRPGPRLYRAIEVLASVLHPEAVEPEPPLSPWERQGLAEAAAPAA